jgi:hypothetical protein
MYNKFMCCIFTIIAECGLYRDLLEIFVDFLFRSLVMLVCIILYVINYLQSITILKEYICIYIREKEEKLFLL